MSFKINDEDEAITEDPTLIIKNGEEVITTEQIEKGKTDYSFNLDNIGMMKINEQYNIVVNASYDLEPERPQKMSLFKKIMSVFSKEEEGEEEKPEQYQTAGNDNLLNKDITLLGNDINYNFHFTDPIGYWMLSMKQPMEIQFDCTNDLGYKVEKVIVDGKEYSTELRPNGYYQFLYKPEKSTQETFHYDRVILENGASFDINQDIYIIVQCEMPTFDITNFEENVKDQTIRYTFKFVDTDGKAASNLKFTLRDSSKNVIEEKEVGLNETSVEFNIPNPPTAVYNLEVNIDLYEILDFTYRWNAHTGSYNSSVTTSILGCSMSTRYPKKGETISVDYTISSSKVVLVDPEDHANLSKALNISSLVINGTEYLTESLGDSKYRIYYTAQATDGLEELIVSQIKFTNDDVQEFNRIDKIDVLKQVPEIVNYKTENDLNNNKVKVSFEVSDPDNLIIGDNAIFAEVNGVTQKVVIGKNELEFDAILDELSKFEIKATYDSDSDTLENTISNDDNYYVDNVIFDKTFVLTGHYGIEFENIQTYNTKGEATKYFEKNEDIKVEFDYKCEVENIYPESLVIGGQEYKVEEDITNPQRYYLTIRGSDTAGAVNASIDAVILNSANTVNLTDKNISYEVLKDAVKVDKFEFTVSNDDADIIKLDINTTDADSANKRLRIEVKDEYGITRNTEPQELQIGQNTVTLEKTSAEKYFVAIYSDYDRDSDKNDGANLYTNERVYYEVVTINNRYIEMKDIVDIEFYTYGATGSVEKVEQLTSTNLDILDNCLVKVIMKDLSEFYAEVESKEVLDGKLKLKLSYGDSMIYDGEDLKPLEVTLNILQEEDGYRYDGSFRSLVEQLKNCSENETVKLTKDYDLSDYPTNMDDSKTAIIDDFEFKGTIDGNGHTITNLHKPLFKTTRGATIENIVFKRISYVNPNQKAVVVHTGYATTISNVHIDEITSSMGGNYNSDDGVFAYVLRDNSMLQNSSATNIKFETNYLSSKISGGVVGLYTNSQIQNCYVQGSISSGWHRNSGLVAESDKTCEIDNNIVNINISPYWSFDDNAYGHGNGGIVSSSNGAILKNNLSLVDGNANIASIYNFKNSTISDESVDNYQLTESAATKNKGDGIKDVAKEEINADFFRTKVHFDEKIWSIDENTSFNNLPILKGISVSFSDGGYQPKNTNVYIPDYNRIYHMEEYNPKKEIIYHNMYKLMPFYDAKEILTDGNKIDENDILNKQFIRYILAYDKTGQMVSSVSTKNYKDLAKIKVVFESEEYRNYNIDFDDYYGNVTSYIISELNTGYNYNKYVIYDDSEIIQELVDYISKYNYSTDLDPLTSAEDSRLYREHYENYTKNHLKEFVENTLVSLGYMPTFENDVLYYKIQQEIVDNDLIKQLLYAYNYFTYWYNIDMDGVNVADSIMFHGNEMFEDRMTFSKLSAEVVTGTNLGTNATVAFYNNSIAKYTKLSSIVSFFDYYVQSLTHYTNGDEWFADTWKGGVYNPIDIGYEDTLYKFWDHFRAEGKVQNSFLPLFTVPENSMYVITCPTQVFFGSLRVYIDNPNNPDQMKLFNEKLAVFSGQVKNFYTFAHTFVGAEYMNPFHDVQYDRRTTYVTSDVTVYNSPNTTQEAYHKYFAEAIGKWPASNGSGAYATGYEVYWVAIRLIEGFRVSTHESLHNQDSKVFLQGNGRRGAAEDYTAGNLQQYYIDGWVSPNFMQDLYPEVDKQTYTQNLKIDRVSTPDKLQDYYKKFFRLNDYLDWIEAKAFFQLSDAEKVAVASQVTYPNLPNTSEAQAKGDSKVAYSPITEDMVKEMKLNDMQSLWDNRIMLRPNNTGYEEHSPGAGTESLYNTHWYQPHADDSRPDGGNFKYLAWQMAGEGGYYDGYMAYFSQKYVGNNSGKPGDNTTDLKALRYIMKNDKITFKEYKLNRYKELESNFNVTGTYINSQQIYEEYLEALKLDAARKDRKLTASTNVKRKYFVGIKNATDDFTIDPFTQQETPLEEEKESTISLPPTMLSINQEEKTNEASSIIEDAENQNANTNMTNSNDNSNTTNATVNKKETEDKDNKNTTSN